MIPSHEIAARQFARVERMIEDVTAGRPIDLRRHATLQALDTVQLGRAFVHEAEQREREADERIFGQLSE